MHCRLPLVGAVKELARSIGERTGSPACSGEDPALRPILAAAFPGLPAPAALEGCTDHPALIARFPVEGFGREAVKAVFLPRMDALEVRLRLEIPGGSYRKETILRLLAALDGIGAAVEGPGEGGGPPAGGKEGQLS